MAVVEFVVLIRIVEAPGGTELWMDYVYYRDVGGRWLSDGSLYRPHQLSGPYEVALMVDVVYPPSALLLFVPLVFVPAAMWWFVPLAILGFAWHVWRPAPWVFASVLAFMMWPRSIAAFLYGNTDMWAAAAIAAGLLWGWPALLLTIKPSLAPLALIGIKNPFWWKAGMILFLTSLLSLPLWVDYVMAMRGVTNLGLDYSFGSIPLLLVPAVMWLGRSSHSRAAGNSRTNEWK